MTRSRSGWPRPIALVVILGLATFYLSRERSKNPDIVSLKGVPIVVAVLLGLLIVLTFALTRTSWGRHVYAVGGNAEAARRSGINVAADQAVLLHDLFHPRRGRRCPAGQPRQLGLADDRWRADPAVRRGRRRHRWLQPVRRQGPGRRRDHRWSGDRGHRQRHVAAEPVAGPGLHGHRSASCSSPPASTPSAVAEPPPAAGPSARSVRVRGPAREQERGRHGTRLGDRTGRAAQGQPECRAVPGPRLRTDQPRRAHGRARAQPQHHR